MIDWLCDQLRKLLRRMKGKSGLNDSFQSHKNKITNASLLNFLRMAKNHHLGSQNPNSEINQAIVDHYYVGTSKLLSQAGANDLQHFHWQDPEVFDPTEDYKDELFDDEM